MNNVDPMNLQEYNDNFKESTTFSINWPHVNNTPEAEQEE
jgi:hypothetical protein